MRKNFSINMNLPEIFSQQEQCLVAAKYSEDELKQFADYEEKTSNDFLYRYTLLLHFRAKKCVEEYLKGNSIRVTDFCVDWAIFAHRIIPILKDWGYEIDIIEKYPEITKLEQNNKIFLFDGYGGIKIFKLKKL